MPNRRYGGLLPPRERNNLMRFLEYWAATTLTTIVLLIIVYALIEHSANRDACEWTCIAEGYDTGRYTGFCEHECVCEKIERLPVIKLP